MATFLTCQYICTEYGITFIAIPTMKQYENSIRAAKLLLETLKINFICTIISNHTRLFHAENLIFLHE